MKIFKAFQNRNYVLYFSGQSVSLIGTWMQRTSVNWLVYTITHSAFMLGLSIFLSQFPSFLFSLIGGILSDRYNRYKIIILLQCVSMIQAILLTVLTFSNHSNIFILILLSCILGVVNAFEIPARQPLIYEMLADKSDLANALALNSSMVNLARLLGPALAGIVLEKFGAGICFMVNSISFIAVITSFLLMKFPKYEPNPIQKNIKTELSEGFNYIQQTPTISSIILMISFTAFLVFPFESLLPVLAKTVFMGDATTFGYMRSCIALGAISGSIFLASLKKGTDLRIVLLASALILGIGLIFFSRISYFPVAMIFAVVAGLGTISQSTICNTIIQTKTEPHMRGRVISFFTMGLFGMLPLGSLLVGSISEKIGASNTILGQGIISIGIAMLFFRALTKK